jgi:aspartyl-tRNA(Asn)/glutamyl-tRNA(Gln) amidotransferase subunit C
MKFDVDKIANLARLELTDGEKKHLHSEMENIVDYVDMLTELELDGIEPTAHAVPLTNVMRKDAEGSSFPREDMLQNAPATVDDELIKVPQVIEG